MDRAVFPGDITCVGMGSQLLKSDLIKNKDFKKLEEDVCVAVTLVKRLREQYPVNL